MPFESGHPGLSACRQSHPDARFLLSRRAAALQRPLFHEPYDFITLQRISNCYEALAQDLAGVGCAASLGCRTVAAPICRSTYPRTGSSDPHCGCRTLLAAPDEAKTGLKNVAAALEKLADRFAESVNDMGQVVLACFGAQQAAPNTPHKSGSGENMSSPDNTSNSTRTATDDPSGPHAAQ